MAKEWRIDLAEMEKHLELARKRGDTRLFAMANEPGAAVYWNYARDEAGMMKYLNSRERSESIAFNCSIAVVVVNPQDSNETVDAIILGGRVRQGAGPGYFEESFFG